MTSFKRGLHNKNPLVLLAAGVLTVAALLGLQALFTSGAWTVIPLKYWVRSPGDAFMVVSWNTSALKRDPPKRPLVVLTAGSSGREAIWSGDSLAAQVKEDGGPSIVASNLSSPKQSIGQSLAILDNLPTAPATTVLIGVNLSRLYEPVDDSLQQVIGRNLLLKSDTLRRFAVSHFGRYKYSYTILPGLLSSLTTLVKTYGTELTQGDLKLVHYDPHPFDNRPDLTPARLQSLRKWANSVRPLNALKANLGSTVALLDTMIKRGRARGLNIVLVELPHNPGVAGPGLARAQAYYRGPIRALAAKYDISYIDFNDQLGLKASDYYDFSHLRPSGRDLWQAKLSQVIAQLYRGGVIRGAKDDQKDGGQL